MHDEVPGIGAGVLRKASPAQLRSHSTRWELGAHKMPRRSARATLRPSTLSAHVAHTSSGTLPLRQLPLRQQGQMQRCLKRAPSGRDLRWRSSCHIPRRSCWNPQPQPVKSEEQRYIILYYIILYYIILYYIILYYIILYYIILYYIILYLYYIILYIILYYIILIYYIRLD